MCLAQGHNAVTPVRLEPMAPRFRVKNSTTESLRCLSAFDCWYMRLCTSIGASSFDTSLSVFFSGQDLGQMPLQS